MPSPIAPAKARSRRQQSSKPTALWWVLGVLTLLAIGQSDFLAPPGAQVSYSEFKELVPRRQVAEVAVGDTIIRGTLKKAENGATAFTRHASKTETRRGARSGEGEVLGRDRQPMAARDHRLGPPFVLIVAAWSFFAPPSRRRRGGVMSFARSKARSTPKTTSRPRSRMWPALMSGAGAARDRRVPEDPSQVHEPWRQDSERRAAGRPSGHRQDPARSRGRG